MLMSICDPPQDLTTRHGPSTTTRTVGLLAVGSPAEAATVVVGTINSNNEAPFFEYSGEYQQVYLASKFSGPVTINDIAFASSTSDIPKLDTLNLTISLSTTAATLSTLSSNFATNEGPDETQVYSGVFTFMLTANNTFDLVFPTSAFVYDPSKGNLLLTIDTLSSGALATFAATTDPVTSRVYILGDPLHPVPTVQADFGLVTEFTVTPTSSSPEPNDGLLLLSTLLAGGVFGILRSRAVARKKPAVQ